MGCVMGFEPSAIEEDGEGGALAGSPFYLGGERTGVARLMGLGLKPEAWMTLLLRWDRARRPIGSPLAAAFPGGLGSPCD